MVESRPRLFRAKSVLFFLICYPPKCSWQNCRNLILAVWYRYSWYRVSARKVASPLRSVSYGVVVWALFHRDLFVMYFIIIFVLLCGMNAMNLHWLYIDSWHRQTPGEDLYTSKQMEDGWPRLPKECQDFLQEFVGACRKHKSCLACCPQWNAVGNLKQEKNNFTELKGITVAVNCNVSNNAFV